MKRIIGSLLVLCISGALHAQTCGKISFPMDYAPWEVPIANNDSGVIVGKLQYDYDGQYNDAFVWKQGVATVLPGLRGSSTVATAINAKGQIIGIAADAKDQTHAVTWVNGVLTQLPHLSPSTPGTVSVAWGINAWGRIVGASHGADSSWHAVRWHNGKIIDLNQEIGAFASFAPQQSTRRGRLSDGPSWMKRSITPRPSCTRRASSSFCLIWAETWPCSPAPSMMPVRSSARGGAAIAGLSCISLVRRSDERPR